MFSYTLPTLPSIILERTKCCSYDFLQSLGPFFPLFVPYVLVFPRVMSFCFLLLPPQITNSNAYKSQEGAVNIWIGPDVRQQQVRGFWRAGVYTLPKGIHITWKRCASHIKYVCRCISLVSSQSGTQSTHSSYTTSPTATTPSIC